MSTRIAAAALAILVGGVGYQIGVAVGACPGMTELTEFRDAVAYAGDNQAIATADGKSFTVDGRLAAVQVYDAAEVKEV